MPGQDSSLTAHQAAAANPASDQAKEPAPPSGLPAEAEVQLKAYFRAYGIDTETRLEALVQQVAQRLAARTDAQAVANPVQVAIETAQGLIDGWLQTLLELQDASPQTAAAARAALRFGAATPHWPAAFLTTESDAAVRAVLQAAPAQSVPPRRQLRMEMQPIEFHHLFKTVFTTLFKGRSHS